MDLSQTIQSIARTIRIRVVCSVVLWSVLVFALPSISYSQDVQGDYSASTVDPAVFNELLEAAKNRPETPERSQGEALDFFSLLIKGGIFVLPIAVVSIVAVALIIERLFGLRRGRMVPRGLIRKVGKTVRDHDTVDPRILYGICNEYPSTASTVVKTLLTRVGRDEAELKAASAEILQREADKAFGSVRWLNFATGVAPLLGLLGTVWGLIEAFHDMTQLSATQNRAEFLGRGIYVALVTTLAGLMVAIPTALAAHFFEGRISRIFREIEEMLFAIIPKFERYQGRVRFDVVGRELLARNIESKSLDPKSPEIRVEKVSLDGKPKPIVTTTTSTSNLKIADDGFETKKSTTIASISSPPVQPLVRKPPRRSEHER